MMIGKYEQSEYCNCKVSNTFGLTWFSDPYWETLQRFTVSYIMYDFDKDEFVGSGNAGRPEAIDMLIGLTKGNYVVYTCIIDNVDHGHKLVGRLLIYDALHPVWVSGSTRANHGIRAMNQDEQVEFFHRMLS